MKKKILAITLCVAMLAIMLVSGTLAYFTDEDTKENVFTVGNVDIELKEENWEEIENAYPGQKLDKDPTVTNNGSNGCFVRIEVTGLDQFEEDFDGATIKYLTDDVEDELGENWTLHTDGYFYYTKVLAAGATTEALFEQIMLPTALTNSTDAEAVVVTAYAVQAEGIETAGETPTLAEIAAWMEICLS